MSHYHASIPTSARKTVPTATGRKSTGIKTIAASYAGAIETTIWWDEEEKVDRFCVRKIPWQGNGKIRMLKIGVIGR